MKLIRTSFLSSISTSIQILCGLVTTKIVAVYVGPAGLAIFGNFQNFVSVAMTFANGAINTGVTKYVAEYNVTSQENLRHVLSSAFKISLVASGAISLLLILFAKPLSSMVLHTAEYRLVFILFGLTITLFVLNGFFLAVINGYKQIRLFVFLSIVSSLVSLVFTSFLAIRFRLLGVLIASSVNQSIVFFVTLLFLRRMKWFRFDDLWRTGYDKKILVRLFKYSTMSAATALVGPPATMFVRSMLVRRFSWEAAGCWQGITAISSGYLSLVTVPLGVYYLPRLSEIQDQRELRHEILSGYKTFMPVVGLGALCIYLLRDIIIQILFSSKFAPMSDLFAFQMAGDVFKIASWALGYIMVAKAMTRMFIITEVIFTLTFVALAALFTTSFGLRGVTYAFALNYFAYLVVLGFIFRDLLFGEHAV